MEQFVVVRRVPGTDNDFKPIHPGSTSKFQAEKLKLAMHYAGFHCEVWTQAQWDTEDDRISAECFCYDCGEELDFCRCPKSSEDHWRDNYLLPGGAVR